mgnify:CR=1 FL=1
MSKISDHPAILTEEEVQEARDKFDGFCDMDIDIGIAIAQVTKLVKWVKEHNKIGYGNEVPTLDLWLSAEVWQSLCLAAEEKPCHIVGKPLN